MLRDVVVIRYSGLYLCLYLCERGGEVGMILRVSKLRVSVL